MAHLNRNSILLTVALLAMTLAFTFSLSIVSPPAPDADHEFDTEAALLRLTRILGDERPHPVDTDANDAVRERLLTEIRQLGFDPIVRDDFRCTDYFGVCARVQNVMFWAVPPTDDDQKGVALMSHYDSIPAGPGAGDDGAGVAVGLEVAHILKNRDDLRPVLILITDGEEIGLLGAESFVYTDPLAARIDAVVNVEARGVRGPISMFQTSNPNGRDIAAIAKTGRTALSNTLTTSIYEAMPNDTDLSRFLDVEAPRQVDATNFAFILGDQFYHTPGDNLANLNPGTVFHSGVNALASVERFARQASGDVSDGKRLYFDILTRGTVSVPFWFGPAIILLSGLLSIIALVQTGTARGWRGWALMPAALIGVGLAAVALSWLIGLVTAGHAYSPAHPWALRGAVSAIAVLVAAASTVALLGRDFGPDERRIGAVLKSWLWVSVLAAIGWLVFPSTITFFTAALFIAGFGIASALFKRGGMLVGLSLLAALLYVLINLPMLGFALAGLGGMAAPFAVLWAIPVVIIVIALPTRKQSRLPLGALSGLTAALIAAAIFVPTYTPKAPRAVSIQHIASDAGSFVQIIGRSEPPQAMRETGAFTYDNPLGETLRAYTRPRWTRAAESVPDIEAAVSVLGDTVAGETRTISLRLTAPTADRLHIAPASPEGMWTSLSVNGESIEPSAWGTRIAGRAVRDLRLDITLPAGQPIGQMAITRFGLGANMKALAASRPDWTLPRQAGDVRVRLLAIDDAITP